MKLRETSRIEPWPALPQSAWSDTCATLHMWMQIVGKIRMALTPALNHTWHVALYLTARGITTSPMPYGSRMLEIEFDFLEHLLRIDDSNGNSRHFLLEPMTVAEFYRRVMDALDSLSMPVPIWPVPCEVADPIPFAEDVVHHSYDADYAQRFWRVLSQSARVFQIFRARFSGKVSPVHLFWGALDLACTRFSGRRAPQHPSMPGLPDRITHDAYSHEVSSCGFWPGAPGVEPFFYSYAYPEPPGYAACPIEPAAAKYDPAFGEYVLPYDAMRVSDDPDATLLNFLETTYEAACTCATWDRDELMYRPPAMNAPGSSDLLPQ